jgi:hypothetical protein
MRATHKHDDRERERSPVMHQRTNELPDRLPTSIFDDVVEPPLSRPSRRPRSATVALPAVAALILIILLVALL